MMVKSDSRTLVLVGYNYDGKSRTCNSILGKMAFEPETGLRDSELETTVMEDGQILNVINTPGLYYPVVDFERNGKEIVDCIKLAIDGIHAVLVVFSVSERISNQDKDAISSLQAFFGKRICDYIIVVFTGGDELEKKGKTFESFLSNCPKALKEILRLCGNRFVLFDNETDDKTKKINQLQRLHFLVNQVLKKNGGEPFKNDVFYELKKWTTELQRQKEEFQVLKKTRGYAERVILKQMENMHADHLSRTTEMIGMMLLEMQWMFEVERQCQPISTSSRSS